MNIYPAIDLLEGKVVRLKKGNFGEVKVYSDNPAYFAKKWTQEGAKWIHVVDLDGAKSGLSANKSSLKSICESTPAKIQFGGGIRSIDDISKALDLGVTRVVLGTKALDPKFLEEVTEKFEGRIALGLDVRLGKVKTEGWIKEENLSLEDAINTFNQYNIEAIIYTDIEKDGVLEGPNWERLLFVLDKSKSNIILSGGISNFSDIEKCAKIKEPNFDGMIIGKALYDEKILLADAIKTCC